MNEAREVQEAPRPYIRDAPPRAVLRVVRERPAPGAAPFGRSARSAPPGRSASPGTGSERGLEIDRSCRTVHVDGRELDLTYLEFELLSHLVAHPRQVHSRERLVSTVWGYGEHMGDGRTVDVHVARLRRKLGDPHRSRIVTVRRVGYKFTP